ncbi:MAG: FapA family protein [Oscillospiraceae bacterium]
MSEKEKSERWSGLLSSLRGTKQEEPEVTPPPALKPPPEKVVRIVSATDGFVTLTEDGTLWRLWQYWQETIPEGERTPLPQLCLNEMPEGHVLPLTYEELETEKSRLLTGAERWARVRLQRIVQQRANENPAPIDAQCFAHISQNGMVAWLLAVPPMWGGEELTAADIAAELRKKGIIEGVDPTCDTLPYFQLRQAAWGVPVVPGDDGCVVERFSREHIATVVQDERGNVDFKTKNYVQKLNKGDVICDMILPREGTEGIQVTGKHLPPPSVKPAVPPRGSNTEMSADGLRLIASMDGHLAYTGNVFVVKSTLEISGDVDYSTGNVDFHGDVHIAGDVREKFSVRATGSITIGGLVEAATIEAEGDILVEKGVQGGNGAVLKSKKTIRAKYLESCEVYCGECVYADSIITSQVYSDHRICVTSGRGTIIGGTLTAAEEIQATIIGSQNGRRTDIILGTLPNVKRELQENRRELSEVEKELPQLGRQLSYLEARTENPESKAKLDKLRLRKSILSMKQEKLTKRQKELEAARVDKKKCRLLGRTIYPPTSVTIGTFNRLIEAVWHDCTVAYDGEQHDIVVF